MSFLKWVLLKHIDLLFFYVIEIAHYLFSHMLDFYFLVASIHIKAILYTIAIMEIIQVVKVHQYIYAIEIAHYLFSHMLKCRDVLTINPIALMGVEARILPNSLL
ncbi:hypothetical protein ACJX0J_026111, partial [Zea mays]